MRLVLKQKMFSFLDSYDIYDENEKVAHEEIRANAAALMDTLKSFGVRIQEITYSRGPTITRYELKYKRSLLCHG